MENNIKRLSLHTAALEADLHKPLNVVAGPLADQVRKHLSSLGDLRGFTEVAPVGQGPAGIAQVAALELAVGLVKLTLVAPGQQAARAGVLDLAAYRHDVVRARRNEIPSGQSFAGYTVLDGAGRGLTPTQLGELAALLGCAEADIRVMNVGVGQVDTQHPETGMVDKILSAKDAEERPLTSGDLGSGRIIYLPPGLGTAAIVQATTVYGLGESWPRVIRLGKGADNAFHVDEVVDVQALRQVGAELVTAWAAKDAPILTPRSVLDRALTAAAGVGDVSLVKELEALLK
jgi:hypothetical protein